MTIPDDITVDAWREDKARRVLHEMNHWDEREWSMAELLITQLREAGVFDSPAESMQGASLHWQCKLGEHTWGGWQQPAVPTAFDPPMIWRRCLVSGCGELDWRDA